MRYEHSAIGVVSCTASTLDHVRAADDRAAVPPWARHRAPIIPSPVGYLPVLGSVMEGFGVLDTVAASAVGLLTEVVQPHSCRCCVCGETGQFEMEG